MCKKLPWQNTVLKSTMIVMDWNVVNRFDHTADFEIGALPELFFLTSVMKPFRLPDIHMLIHWLPGHQDYLMLLLGVVYKIKILQLCFYYKQTYQMLGIEFFQWWQLTRPATWQKINFYNVNYCLWVNVWDMFLMCWLVVLSERDFQKIFSRIPHQS
jgi:hypothetical protein